ncbi:TPA: hypothetical protein ACH3X3_011158 [Trebouxia sp. C0006]
MAIEFRQRPTGHSTDDTDSPAASSAAVAVDRSVAVAESCSQSTASVSTSLGQEGAFVVHAFALLCYVRVWLWHLTPAAQLLPGSTGFGWFFRYLTFYSFSWQMLQLFIACLADISKDPHNSRMLNIWADDLSCALFGMANSVTAMFYLIDATTGKDSLVEGGEIDRPPWLGFSVHVFNTIVAWADIFCAHPRSFSKRSGRLSVGIIAFYTVWILICSHFNGAFPYPILNKLPWPAGFIGMATTSIVLFYLMFLAGRQLCKRLLLKRSKVE